MKSERDRETHAMWDPESFGLFTVGFPLSLWKSGLQARLRKSCTEPAWLAFWKYFWLSGLWD